MSKSYENMSKELISAVGGIQNIDEYYHCATRLRIKVKDKSKLNRKSLENIEGISASIIQGNEVQNVVGTDVNAFYLEFSEYIKANEQHTSNYDNGKETKKDKSFISLTSKILDFISGVLIPIMPVFLASGLLLAILNVCVNVFGFSDKSGTYHVFCSIALAGFYFLPIYVGFQAAIKLKIPPVMGAFLGAITVFDGINNTKNLDILGVPIKETVYNGTIIPSIIGVLCLSIIYKWLDKKLIKEVKYFITPILSISITAPLVLFIFGPLGTMISELLANLFIFLSGKLNWLAFSIYSGVYPIMVVFGIDKGTIPISLNNITNLGFDSLVLPAALASNTAVGSAALTVGFWSKNKKTKSLGYSAGITGILGITEPALFGFLIPYRKAFMGAIIGAVIGGLFGGIMNIVQGAQIAPGLVALTTFYVGSSPAQNIINGFITLIISVVSSFIATSILIKRDKNFIDDEKNRDEGE